MSHEPAPRRAAWFRWHILRTLLHKEVLRHLANRGGIFLVLLLVVASLLLSMTGKSSESQMGGLVGGVKQCYVDHWQHDEWIEHLRNHRPPELRGQIRFRDAGTAPTSADGSILYPPNTGGIQIRPN